MLQENEVPQIFWKTNISYYLIRTHLLWRALFSCDTHFEICPFGLLPTNISTSFWFKFDFSLHERNIIRKQIIQTEKATIRKSENHQKNTPHHPVLNSNQWQPFSENYKPIRISLGLFYKITENNCFLWLFTEIIRSQKWYSTSLDKISILTWRPPVMTS